MEPAEMAKYVDSLTVCLSKGLGAPIGSLLIGTKTFIEKARRIRKALGGGMRQVGYFAAAGLYALEHNINRLAEDHRRAKELGLVLEKQNWVSKVEPIDTNIVIFSIQPEIQEFILIEILTKKGISISSMGNGKLRMVTHLDYREVMHEYVMEVLVKLKLN
jgi:threonine aldolase